MFNKLLFIGIVVSITCLGAKGCDQREYGEDSFVCVCTEQSCDTFPPISTPAAGTFGVLKTSRDEFRFDSQFGSLQSSSSPFDGYATISIDSSVTRQTIRGFGGAFTDATGINVAKLSQPLQSTFVSQYFSPDGLEYNTGRIPIAGTDFSTRPYSYDDVAGDTDLVNFSLTDEDNLYKIPIIKRALEVSQREMLFFSTPWSPPSWMKTNGMFNGSGSLLPEMRQPYANYYVKFFDAYAEQGINIWGLTVQNEPGAGNGDYGWNCCYFSPEAERDFLRDYLGPTLAANGHENVFIMIGDDQRSVYPQFAQTILADPAAAAFVDGIAVHWYTDDSVSSDVLDQLHDMFPDKPLLYTEACNGDRAPDGDHVLLGNWKRGENYAKDILDDVNHWCTGWTDWNMALGLDGGPNWANNQVDSPIIVEPDANEFYKQPMFYVLGHFSKFLPNGAVNIGSTLVVNGLPDGDQGGLATSAFRHPDGYNVVIVLNTNEDAKTIGIEDTFGNLIVNDLPPKSIQTYYYNEQ